MLTLTDDKLLKFVLIWGKSCVVFVWREKLGWPRTLFIILLMYRYIPVISLGQLGLYNFVRHLYLNWMFVVTGTKRSISFFALKSFNPCIESNLKNRGYYVMYNVQLKKKLNKQCSTYNTGWLSSMMRAEQ